MTRAEKGKELFEKGYNCAQSTAGAFCDLLGMEFDTVVKAVSTFGGGFGKLREVCGALSGVTYVLGNLYGYSSFDDIEEKALVYARTREVGNRFKSRNGSLICRVLLGEEEGKTDLKPAERNAEFYAVRPCVELVGSAIEILEEVIEEIKQGKI